MGGASTRSRRNKDARSRTRYRGRSGDIPGPKNRTGRGYVQGRWRGTQELYGELEWRFRITNNGLLGGVVFANAGSFAAPAFQASGPGWSYASEKVGLLHRRLRRPLTASVPACLTSAGVGGPGPAAPAAPDPRVA